MKKSRRRLMPVYEAEKNPPTRTARGSRIVMATGKGTCHDIGKYRGVVRQCNNYDGSIWA